MTPKQRKNNGYSLVSRYMRTEHFEAIYTIREESYSYWRKLKLKVNCRKNDEWAHLSKKGHVDTFGKTKDLLSCFCILIFDNLANMLNIL